MSGCFSPPEQSLIGPVQLLPHGVAVEHILVQFGEGPFPATGIPLLSLDPCTGQTGAAHEDAKLQALYFTLISSARWFRSSGTSSLKHILPQTSLDHRLQARC